MQMVWEMKRNPEKFVRRGPFWQMSKRNQQIQKVIMHGNGVVYEPGGREMRCHDPNPRFNYKQV